MTPTDDRPLLLMVTTGMRSYREYLMESISTHYRVHLLLGAEPTWEQRYITGWTVLHKLADTIDSAEMCAAARELNARDPVAGVLTWDEARVLQTAEVAADLGLPGGDPQAAMRTRDKHLTREALDRAGVPQARSILVSALDEAIAAADAIGYPVVVKPRAMAASLGAVLVESVEELTAQFAFARDTTIPGAWTYDQNVLIEEYLRGPEISVDSAVHAGEVLPMFVARKQIGYPPYFEEVGHVVDAADPLITHPEFRRILQDTHDALGFTDGITHAEFKLTAAGPKVIEVNGRLGGDMIPYLGLRATGIDPGLAAAAVACGRRPEVTAGRSLIGAVRFCYVENDDTVIGEIRFDDTALPAAADLFVPLASPGDVKSPPPKGCAFGRIAYATAIAETARECEEALDAVQAALTVLPADPGRPE